MKSILEANNRADRVMYQSKAEGRNKHMNGEHKNYIDVLTKKGDEL